LFQPIGGVRGARGLDADAENAKTLLAKAAQYTWRAAITMGT
jgi:hypothetical protein